VTAAEVLRTDRVSMRFGNVVALHDVSISVNAGTVTCLLGDNGAGKSTLIRILSGVHRPTAGRYQVDGQTVSFASPRDALARGIATVHQDLALIPLMPVWRNFVLGSELLRGARPFRRLDVIRSRAVTCRGLSSLGVSLEDVDRALGTLSGGERQCVAIARALHFGARVLILDEPTAALGVRQSQIVLRAIRAARDRGAAVILVTHNPQHAHAVGERFIVLRHGRVAGELLREDAGPQDLFELMSGEERAG
jgi:simple sugar transport system ATP-binding protein